MQGGELGGWEGMEDLVVLWCLQMYTMHINEYFWKYHTLEEQQMYQEEKDVDEFTLLNLAERFN